MGVAGDDPTHRVGKVETLLLESSAGNKLADEVASPAAQQAAAQLRSDMLSGLAYFGHLLCNRQRLLVLGSIRMKQALSPEQRDKLLGSLDCFGQHSRPRQGLADLRGGKPLRLA